MRVLPGRSGGMHRSGWPRVRLSAAMAAGLRSAWLVATYRPGRPHLRGRGDRGPAGPEVSGSHRMGGPGRPAHPHRGGRGGAGPVCGPTWVRLRPGRCGRRLRGHRPRGGLQPARLRRGRRGASPTSWLVRLRRERWLRRGPLTHDGSGVGRAGGGTPLGRFAGEVGRFFRDRLRSVAAVGVYSGTFTCRRIGFG